MTEDMAYFLERNPTEVERLRYQHEVIKDFTGTLVLAPMDFSKPGLRILDSATADGLWLRDLQSTLPPTGYTYIGTDIVASYFPPTSPPHTTLTMQSITKPWPAAWHASFDLVHQRLALPGCGTYPIHTAVAALISLVKPGGWIQLIEADHSGPASDGTAMRDAFRLIKELFGHMGVAYEYARHLRGWLEHAGLERIEERVLDVPLGAANPKPEMAAKGVRSFTLATAGLVAAARVVPTSFAPEQLDGLAQHVERELAKIGGIHRLYAVWGRKPVGATTA